MATAPPKRAVCSRCQRPQRACYCSALPPTTLRTHHTRVVVIQHAKEQRQRQAISSVPVLAQVLTSPTSVHVVPVDVDIIKRGEAVESSVPEVLCARLHDELDRMLLAEQVEAVLVLFPHVDAKPLTPALMGDGLATDPDEQVSKEVETEVSEEKEKETEKTLVLVVVDGTWTEAKKIVHHSRAFWEEVMRDRRGRGKVFEYVCLDPTAVGGSQTTSSSIYGELRKEPMEGCVSTLEAVAMALRIMEPESHVVCEAMLAAFQGMVAIQTEFLQRGKAEQQAKHGGTPKPKHTSRLPQRELPTTDHEHARQGPDARGVVKPYVFYTTHTDFRKRQRLVREGDVHVCTRDEAIALCNAMNRHRKRGNRVSTLPEEVFERQAQCTEQELGTSQ